MTHGLSRSRHGSLIPSIGVLKSPQGTRCCADQTQGQLILLGKRSESTLHFLISHDVDGVCELWLI